MEPKPNTTDFATLIELARLRMSNHDDYDKLIEEVEAVSVDVVRIGAKNIKLLLEALDEN